MIFIRFHFFNFSFIFAHFCYASDTFINVVSKNDYFIYHQDSGKFLYLFWWKFHIANGLARSSHELVNVYFLICVAFIPIFILHFFSFLFFFVVVVFRFHFAVSHTFNPMLNALILKKNSIFLYSLLNLTSQQYEKSIISLTKMWCSISYHMTASKHRMCWLTM